MLSWILSKLFPPTEPIYHAYRRETKKIPVLTPSQAWAYYLHMRKGISAFGMSADQVHAEMKRIDNLLLMMPPTYPRMN